MPPRPNISLHFGGPSSRPQSARGRRGQVDPNCTRGGPGLRDKSSRASITVVIWQPAAQAKDKRSLACAASMRLQAAWARDLMRLGNKRIL